MTRPDHRMVLRNPHLGWPADVVADAEAQRDAELRALRPDAPPPEPGPYERALLAAPVPLSPRPRPESRMGFVIGAVFALGLIGLFALLWGP